MIRLLVSLLAAFAVFPAAALAHEGTEVTVKGDVRAGGPIEIEGEEFEANDIVRIELRKDGVEPIELARVTADEGGAFTVTLHVPEDVKPGLHQLAAEGEESATFDLTVLEPAEGGAPPEVSGRSEPVANDRPASETVALGIFTAVVAIAAAGLLWTNRTRTHRIRVRDV